MKSVSSGLSGYLSSLTVTQGRRAGQRFICLPWQRSFVAGAWAEGISEAGLSVARGNGKTALLSGIAAATLDGPLVVPRGETVIVASSFEQARIAFDHVLAFLGEKLHDRKRWRVWDTLQAARIQDRQTLAMVRCIGSGASAPTPAEPMVWHPCWYWQTSPRNGRRPRARKWSRLYGQRQANSPIQDL